jgi:hypothetical protein
MGMLYKRGEVYWITYACACRPIRSWGSRGSGENQKTRCESIRSEEPRYSLIILRSLYSLALVLGRSRVKILQTA